MTTTLLAKQPLSSPSFLLLPVRPSPLAGRVGRLHLLARTSHDTSSPRVGFHLHLTPPALARGAAAATRQRAAAPSSTSTRRWFGGASVGCSRAPSPGHLPRPPLAGSIGSCRSHRRLPPIVRVTSVSPAASRSRSLSLRRRQQGERTRNRLRCGASASASPVAEVTAAAALAMHPNFGVSGETAGLVAAALTPLLCAVGLFIWWGWAGRRDPKE